MTRTERTQLEERHLLFGEHLRSWKTLNVHYRRCTWRNSIPLLRMYLTLIFGQDVAKSKDARRVREPWKIRLHRACPGSIRHYNFSGLQINDILFLLSFFLGKMWIFWRYFYCRWPEDQKIGSTMMPTEGLFLLLASIQAQIIVKGIRRNETATMKTVRKKPLRHWCNWGDFVEGSFVKQNVLPRRVSKLSNESPTADKIIEKTMPCCLVH